MADARRGRGRAAPAATRAAAVLPAAVLAAAALAAAPLLAAAPAGARPPGADPAPTAPPPPAAVDLALPAHPGSADLARVERVVEGLTATARAAARAVEDAAAHEAYLEVRLGQAHDAAAAAHAKLVTAVRTAYESGGGIPVAGFVAATAPGGLTPADLAAEDTARRSVLRVDGAVVDAATRADRAATSLAAAVDAQRRSLVDRAGPVEAAEARAQAVLDAAQQAFAADRAAEAALAAQRARLAALSGEVALTVTPAVGALGRAAQAAQAPLLALLDRTPPGAVPPGFHATGQGVTGLASWYGPGFVGRATSSGSPYDPEQLTCAMLAVPLGSLVRVTTAAGRSVVVLVTDHGPYAGVDRVVDLSERAARTAGVGLTPVAVQVLAPDGS